MCPHPSIPVVHPISGDTLVNASWERTEAIGMTIADAAIRALEGSNATIISSEGISLRAKSFSLKISNKLYILAACCGLLNADTYGWKTMRSEVSAFTIGPASFCTIPGELYPEIANGGVMVCEEGDYVDNTLTTPIESPSLRSMMSSEHSFVFGLANDEIGYIIPYTQWDAKRPFAFDMEEPQYGEANSVGPNAAPIIYQELSKLIKELHEMSIDTL